MAIARRARMRNVEAVIEFVLRERPNGFRNKHVAEALGISPARACQLLARRIRSGELSRIDGPRTRYIRGYDPRVAKEGFARGAPFTSFWRTLTTDYPKLAYVSLRGLGLTELRTRQQIRTALRGMIDRPWHLVVDFDAVHSVADAAAHELFLSIPGYWGMQVEAINADPQVGQAIQYVVRVGR